MIERPLDTNESPERPDAPDRPAAPLLSICLPTYNRAALLREALGAIAGQGGADLFAHIEVLVSDNDSADDTERAVHEARVKYPHLPLHYSRQTENVGGERNMLSLTRRAAGEFIWMISDDDLLLPGALATLLRLIETHPGLDSFCLNAKSFRIDPAEETAPYFALPEDKLFADPDEALRLFETMISFVSLLVFRREAIEGRDYTDRLDSYLTPSYLFLDVLSRRRGVFVTREPFLALRAENSGGFGFFQVFVSQFERLMRQAERQGFSREATQAVMRGNLRRCLFQHTLTFKAHGEIGKLRPNWSDALRRLLCVYGRDPFLIFVIIPLILTPRPVLNGLRFVYRTMRGRPHPPPAAQLT